MHSFVFIFKICILGPANCNESLKLDLGVYGSVKSSDFVSKDQKAKLKAKKS